MKDLDGYPLDMPKGKDIALINGVDIKYFIDTQT